MLAEGEKQKQLDREIRDMISALTRRLADLHHVQKAGGSSPKHDDEQVEDDHGVRIITLAGSNVGATMRGELDEKHSPAEGVNVPVGEEQEPLSAYVNSNFQAINNSIMLGGSYSTNDPGVRVDISDYMEQQHPHPHSQFNHGHVKPKKKGKETFKSDQHSEKSD